MSASSYQSQKPSRSPTSPISRRFPALRQIIQRSINLLYLIEPLWVAVATAFVYMSYLLHIGPVFPWIGLGIALFPFGLRRITRGSLRLNTPFNLSIALLMAGALIGLIVSPEFDMSLGAFQCMLALSLFYYSCINHPRLPTLIRTLVVLSFISLIVAFIIVFVQIHQTSGQADSVPNTYHGVALAALIAVIIFAGMAVFGNHKTTRIVLVLASLCLFIAILWLVNESIPRLFGGESIEGRMARWHWTVNMLVDSPLTGLGLGCWAFFYYGSMVITHTPTHAHNAYLELYSNTGFLGALALLVSLIIASKLGLDIIRSPRNGPWYGFGIGVLLACVATLLVGIVESAPIGVPLVAANTYYYIISPIPWILMALLVIAHRLQCASSRM